MYIQPLWVLPYNKVFTEEQAIALIDLLADFMDTYDNYGVCKNTPVRILAYMQSNGSRIAFEAYTANRIKINGHLFHVTCSVIINILN